MKKFCILFTFMGLLILSSLAFADCPTVEVICQPSSVGPNCPSQSLGRFSTCGKDVIFCSFCHTSCDRLRQQCNSQFPSLCHGNCNAVVSGFHPQVEGCDSACGPSK